MKKLHSKPYIILICLMVIFQFNARYSWAKNNTLKINKLIEDNPPEQYENKRKAQLDIESLGLDNLDKNSSSPSKQNFQSNPSTSPNSESKPLTQEVRSKNIQPTQYSTQTILTIPLADKKSVKNNDSKQNPTNQTQKKSKKKSKKLTPATNKTNPQGKSISKKSPLRIKLEKIQEKQQLKNLNKEKELQKLQKFEELRNLYLSDLLQKKDDQDEDFKESDKITPREKDLAPFAVEELPPLPILNRSRTPDNYHIPYVYTPKEYIDIMFSAISMGSISYFNEAYKYVLNPNAVNEQGDTILTYAIFMKKYAVMTSVLAKGADPNLPNRLGYNPVSIAIELGDFVALEILAKNHADLKYKDAFGRNYLMHASRIGFLPAVDLLVKSGVDVNEMDDDGFTPLIIAYRHKKELVVQYLIKNGAQTWVEKPYNPQKKYFINELNKRWQE